MLLTYSEIHCEPDTKIFTCHQSTATAPVRVCHRRDVMCTCLKHSGIKFLLTHSGFSLPLEHNNEVTLYPLIFVSALTGAFQRPNNLFHSRTVMFSDSCTIVHHHNHYLQSYYTVSRNCQLLQHYQLQINLHR